MKKHNNIANTIKRISVLFMLTGLLFYAISCEEEKLGPPVITNVRTPDPATADSSVDRAFPSDYIVIQGENFEGVTHVYFNNYEAYVNQMYVTNTNIIVQIPAEVPLKGLNPDVPNEIKVVTPQGTAVFNFKFLSPVPAIQFLYFNFPVAPDTTIQIYGTDFYEVIKVVLDVDGQQFEVTDLNVRYTPQGHIISFKLPDGAQNNGTLTLFTESGTAVFDFIPKAPPVITGLSRELPVVGDTFTIYGRDFRNIDKIVFPGNVEVDGSDVSVNELKTKINLTMPNALQSGDIVLINEFGDTAIYQGFNDRSLVLYDFDTKGNWVWKWDTTSVANSGGEITAGNGRFWRRSGTCPSVGGWYDDGANGLAIIAWPDIPASTPVEKLAVSISLNTMVPWTDGWLNINVNTAEYLLKPYNNGSVPVNKWIEYIIPLTEFSNMTYVTYADIKALDINAALRLLINGDSTVPFDFDLCWDDFRLVVLE